MAARRSLYALQFIKCCGNSQAGYNFNINSLNVVSRRVISHYSSLNAAFTNSLFTDNFRLTNNCHPYAKTTLKRSLIDIQSNSSVLTGTFSTSPCNSPQDDPEKKPSLYQRFKKMAKEYWYVLIPVHIVTSAFWFGGFYYLAVTGVDIVKLMELIGLPDTWVATMRGSRAGGIVTAYTLYKVATPARYTVTLGGTTLSIKYLRKWGLIKPMPSQAELRTIYENKKEAYRDLKRSYTEKITTTTEEIKDEFKKTHKEITHHMKGAKTGVSKGIKDDIEGFKQGVGEAADEWRHVGKLVKERTLDLFDEKRNKPIQAEFKGEVCQKKNKGPAKGNIQEKKKNQ